jgi:hypothetical protein
MKQQQDDGGGLNPARDIRQGANYLYLALSAWAITIYLPMRYGSDRLRISVPPVMKATVG